ncbi:DUF2142 domain-containing protein [Coprobacillus sp. AM09-26]|jgi:uncharacterized membrane protein|uniref:DUF2142 domain-containing protein n=1 Tax=Faecalibacillus intestinalis TaxID=1982626 RepID=UPI000E42BC17|nr:DUF2142 domain-containing protein [Faecalibacillus intestinalis]RGF24505.1 DUF2142 domain-containing protein [Coprobacillus sp. AM09-26]
MRHAKKNSIFKKDDFHCAEDITEDDLEQFNVRNANKPNRYVQLVINLILVIMVYYFFNSCVKTHNQAVSSIQKMIIFFFLLMSVCLFISVNYILSNREYRLEKLFLIIMIPISITYSLIMIPGMVPDEATHMRLTYSLASQIMGVEKDKTTLRGEEKYIYEHLPQSPNQESYDYSYTHLFSGEDNGKYVTIDEDSANWKQIFWYFPAVIGTVFSRMMHFGATPTLYIARLFNLLFYIWLTYFSIKKIPVGKQLLFVISVLPMCSQQMMSLSYDAILNASSFFCLAYGLFFVYHSEDVKVDEYIKYLFAAVLLLSIKSAIYSFLLLIPLLSKFNNIDGNIHLERKHKIILFLSISILILLLNFVSFGSTPSKEVVESTAVSKHIISWSGTEGYSIGWLLTHPIEGVNLFINTINLKLEWYYYSCLGQDLSWFTVKLPFGLFKVWGLLLLISALKKDENDIDGRMRILFFCIDFIVIFLVMLSMCIYWTPLGYDHIEGVQGRYFIPIIYTIILIINNKRVYLKEFIFRYINIFTCFLIIVTISNLINACFL